MSDLDRFWERSMRRQHGPWYYWMAGFVGGMATGGIIAILVYLVLR